MKSYILLVLAFSVLLAGCTVQSPAEQAPPASQEPTRLVVCPDGVNVLPDIKDCPPYDKEYEDCMKLSTYDEYGDSPRDGCF